MSNEIRVNVSLEHVPTGFKGGGVSNQFDQTNVGEVDGGVQTIGTSEETIVPVDIMQLV